MDGDSAIVKKIAVAQAALAALFAVLTLRLFFIQVVEGTTSTRAAERQHSMIVSDQARRGEIRAADGITPLATSVLVPSLWAEKPDSIPNPAGVAMMLARVIDVDPRQVEHKLMSRQPDGRPYEAVCLVRFLSEEEAGVIKELRIEGLQLRYEYKRRYPNGSLLAHVLGFVTRNEEDRDDLGLEGIEKAFDEYLCVEPGFRVVAADGRRRPIPSITEDYRPTRGGNNVVLTIEPRVQEITEAALEAAYVKWRSAGAAAVVIRVHTGEVLAMASLPTYDPNDPGSSTPEQRRNRVVTDANDPGSTFKPFSIGSAMAEGLVTPDTMISTVNPVNGRKIGDHVKASQLSVRDVVVQSSNVGAARIGLMLGPKLRSYVVDFGFGRPTGIRLPGDADVVGRVTPASQWRSYSSMSVAFGQEITVTPLQLAAAFCSLANGGVYMKPYLVKRIEDNEGNVVESFKPQELRRVLPYEVTEQLKQMLEGVVTDERGTGKSAASKLYRVAGKTGTAQKALPGGGGYSSTDYVGYFVGFAPVENPDICVLVAIDTPKGAHYGGTVAAPVASKIIENSLPYLHDNQLERMGR